MITFVPIGIRLLCGFPNVEGVSQQPGRGAAGRLRRAAVRRLRRRQAARPLSIRTAKPLRSDAAKPLGAGSAKRMRRRASRRILRRRAWRRLRGRMARGSVGRFLLGTAGSSPRLRRLILIVVLLGVALLPYPVLGAAGSPPGSGCQAGCRAGSVPSMVRWTVPLPGSWDVVPGLTGTVPTTGLAYAAVGDGIAAVGHGLTVSGYSAGTGALRWRDTLTGFPAGAAIVSVRGWPGEVSVGVSYRSGGSGVPARTEVVISDAGVQTGRYQAARFGGAVAGSAQDTVIVGPAAVTSYDNATGHVRWGLATGSIAQAWRLDGGTLYLAESSSGFVGSDPVTALRRVDLGTGSSLLIRPLEGASFDGRLSAVTDGVLLFSSASGVTAYGGATGVKLWSIAGAVPEGTDSRPSRVYLTKGTDLVGVDPQTGRIVSTVSGSAVNGTAGVYVVRDGVALGLDQGANGDAWGYSIAAQRVTLAAPGLPWPHYFVDLSGVGGSADPASGTVVIAACKQLGPGSLTRPAPTATTASPPTAPATTSARTSGATSATTAPGTSHAAVPTSSPDISPSAAASTGQPCLRPELVALGLQAPPTDGIAPAG